MTKEKLLEILLDSLKDSGLVFIVVFIIYILFSFFEVKIAKFLSKDNKLSPLFGAMFGLIPQCGISVVSSDLYLKRHITMGTLISVFLSCSDEAIPLLIATHSKKALWVIPLILIKFVIGFTIGFLVDFLIKDKEEVHEHLDHCHHQEEVHTGCCHHYIDDEKESKVKECLVHPLIHSIKIFIYVFIINILFGLLIGFVGEDNFKNFINMNKYLTPLFASLVGLIPNCASSVIITELFTMGNLSFGACLSGLLMNAGLGLVYLLKSKKNIKNTLMIIGIMLISSIAFGYIFCFILGF